MSKKFPDLLTGDIPKYTRHDPADIVASDIKHYPGQNQGQYCWQVYNHYVHCLKMNQRDESACARYKGFYTQICPNDWTEAWDEQREKGVFPGVQLDPLPELLKKH